MRNHLSAIFNLVGKASARWHSAWLKPLPHRHSRLGWTRSAKIAGQTPASLEPAVTDIRQEDFIQSVADALQYISYYHPVDYIRNLAAAYEREESEAAKDAIAQSARTPALSPCS